MTLEEAIKHFKTQANLARALKVNEAAVCNWKRRGTFPELQQMKLEKLTGGKLKV